MMTVIQTQSRIASLGASVSVGWLTFVELVAARRRDRRAARERMARTSTTGGADAAGGCPPMSAEDRAEADLRAAYRLWFGGDPLGRL